MTRKASRALKAALAIGAVAVLSLSLVAMSGCSTSEPAGHATKNVISEPVSSVTPEDCSGTLNAVAYMNYTLAQKDSWHCYKQTYSTATLTTVTTTTYKDYRDNVLVAEELVYGTGFGSSSTASHQLMFTTSPEEDRSVYVRSGSKPASASDGPNDITWNDDVEYWSEAYYNTQYGLFMDEISLYVLNEETAFDYEDSGEVDEEGNPIMVETRNGCGDVVDNEDGTYSQKFELDTVMSTYYYSYSMMTHGGLSSAPNFTSIDVTFTFNADWEIIDVVENDVSDGLAGSTCVTMTHYSYDEEDFDETTYAAGIAFFEPLIGTLEMVDIEADEPEGDDDEDMQSSPKVVTQYEKNLTLTVIMAAVGIVVFVLGIILTGVGCNTRGKDKKNKDA